MRRCWRRSKRETGSDAFERLHRVPVRDKVKDFLTVYIAQHNRTPPRIGTE